MRTAIGWLRLLRDWEKKDLADASGLAPSSISRYESGETLPSDRAMQQIVAAVGLPPEKVDHLFACIRSSRASLAGAAGQDDPQELIDRLTGDLIKGIANLLRSATAFILADLPALGRGPWSVARLPLSEDRRLVPELWESLSHHDASDWPALLKDREELRSSALCERVCAESVAAAPDDADRAVELAELALRIAELVPGEVSWSWRLQGYAWAHVGNARRVRGDLPGAEEAFARAGRLWQAGASGDPGLLNEAQLLSLEASLRISQSRLAEADALLSRALAADRGLLRANLLIKRARLLEWAGEYEDALAVLDQAAGLVPETAAPRLLCMLRFNTLWNLCHLGRYEEAEGLLPEAQELTLRLNNQLDALRLRWLEGRIAGGLGRTQEAREAFSHVRLEFATRGIAYDAALVTLELAVLHLEQGSSREVKALAREMAPIFEAQGVHSGALAALKLFCRTAEKELATVKLARCVVEYLYCAQHNPLLRFEAE